MDTQTANQILQKKKEAQQRKNELQRARRQAEGDEWRKRNNELQQAYRDREKAKLDEARAKRDEEIKKQVKKEVKKVVKKEVKKAEVKKEVKKAEEKPIVKTIKNTGKMISNYERTGIKGLTENTTKTYIMRIKVIHRELSKTELNVELLTKILLGKGDGNDEDKLLKNMEYLKDIDLLIKTIEDKYENLESRKGYLTAFTTLISYMECLYKINYGKIRAKLEEVNNILNGIRGENKPKENEENIDDFDEKTIMENSEKLKVSNDRLIYQFYTLQPPRRLDDVVKIELIGEDYEIDKLDVKKNYIVIDANDEPKEIIYLAYKTKKTYGKQIIQIVNDNLKETIQYHIKHLKLKIGDKLFQYKRSGDFGVAIKRIFTRMYLKPITLNTIRHSYITWELREQRTANYLKNLATMMAHAVEEQQLYKRV
jgi:predicted transcriptional regulator